MAQFILEQQLQCQPQKQVVGGGVHEVTAQEMLLLLAAENEELKNEIETLKAERDNLKKNLSNVQINAGQMAAACFDLSKAALARVTEERDSLKAEPAHVKVGEGQNV